MIPRFPSRAVRGALVLALPLGAALAGAAGAGSLTFTDVTAQAGLAVQHGFLDGVGDSMPRQISGGVAAGDYDRDGLVDLFTIQGEMGTGLLFRNRGDGSFEEVAAQAGVALAPGFATGPTFGDLDGDGWLDLVVGGILGLSPVRVFHNRRDGTFEEVTAATGLVDQRENTFGAAFGDYDQDGDLDLFLAHWTQAEDCGLGECGQHLWRNEGDGTLTAVDELAGLAASYTETDYSFSPNFADIDSDGLPDLLVASDFGTSKVFRNLGGGTFLEITDREVLTDDNGMGSTVADFDRDGDVDWFVTSIWDPERGSKTGNRLYRSRGDGTFADVSEPAGVRVGDWGWGSCAADFDLDGDLDIFHTNGFYNPRFLQDDSRLFLSTGDGTFTEAAAEAGLGADTGQGRGVVCFDYDRDGDLDIYVAKNGEPSTLWRNDRAPGRWLTVALADTGRNPFAVGGRVYVTAGGATQMRELRMGSNFASQDPTEAHFGLGGAERADEMAVIWPGGVVSTHAAVPVDRAIRVRKLFGLPGPLVAAGPTPFDFGGCGDCQVEASLSVAENAPGAGRASLLGWIAADGSRAAVTLDPGADRLTFQQWEAGVSVRRVHRSVPLETDRLYDVKVRFEGERFLVFLDGVQALAVTSGASGAPRGEAGVAVSNATATIENAAVTAVASLR